MNIGDRVKVVRVDRSWDAYMSGMRDDIGLEFVITCAYYLVGEECVSDGETWWFPKSWLEVVSSSNKIDHLEWLQDRHSLHQSVEILYTVDGYDVTITWDDEPYAGPYHGETLAEAIEVAEGAKEYRK